MNNKYKINFKSKFTQILYASFCNFVCCVIFGTLIFAITAAIGIWVFDTDLLNREFITAYCIALFTIFLILDIIYSVKAKYIEINHSRLIINFRYYEFGIGGYAKFKNYFNLKDITGYEYCENKDESYNSLNTKNMQPEYKIAAGDYSRPYIAITVNNQYRLLLPVQNAKKLYQELTDNCSID